MQMQLRNAGTKLSFEKYLEKFSAFGMYKVVCFVQKTKLSELW